MLESMKNIIEYRSNACKIVKMSNAFQAGQIKHSRETL